MKKILKENTYFIILFFIIFILAFLTGCGGVTPTDYIITSTIGTGGSINPSGAIVVSEGGNQTFTITPDDCYQIIHVLVDGISEGPITTYTFTDIQENHTIQASFVSLGPRVYNIDAGVDYSTIQAAIDAALAGDTLIVCPGTYYENIVLDNKNITLRSTDPSNPSTVAATIIRATASDSVVKFIGGDTSTLEGFKITNGNPIYYGGGIYIGSSSPTLLNNVIVNNQAVYGGGIYVGYYSSPIIQNNTITGNEADYSGGGICVVMSSSIIKNNNITENYATDHGGGICVYSDSNIFPANPRPSGWGADRENIPTGIPLVPAEGIEYTIAGNKFIGNEQGTPLDYTEGAHVYFN
jgi:parallel beta-helix repeat protein